ncbi:Cell division protein FtsN [Massilia sp. Bi118]|uniref:SPOR domain-containing protein n=1 Tax=Massilia sp. Bi118 TaxID=2822346 RepID=UPI001DD58354|nr:SPOR domain-containing protein [Massilia sp. Bi118]CAH0231865.1 Cell division protein FtsN [Massilia sp. Bi118]
MGLFSFFGKNKQGRAAEDSGRFYSKDDDAALGERARSKRASSAGAVAGSTRGRGTGNDPLLPEKKRARRRLVGAIALALAAAVGLPMLLDSQPKPLAGDIAIQIPAKDKAAPLPVPAEPLPPVTAPAPVSAAEASRGVKTVAAADSVDKGEEVLQDVPAAPRPVAKAPAAVDLPKPERKPEPPKAKAEAKPEPKPEHKPEHKPDAKAEHKLADKADKADKPVKPKSEDKPVKPHDDSRALAILEGKAADKADKADKPADTGSQKVVLQVAAMSSQEKAAELQARLHSAGISSYTQKSGELVKVKIGPLSKEEAEKVRAKLGRIGLSGFQTPA